METEPKRTTDQILDLAAQRRHEKQVVDVEVEKTLIVIFHLQTRAANAQGGLHAGLYGLPASAIESIVPLEQITYVPGTPSWILGVVNVRGEIESVLDLKAVLGLARTELTPESRLLIAQDEELRSGLLVDRMIDIAEFPQSALSAPPAPLEGGKGIYVAGETEYGDDTLVILDLHELFRHALESDRV